ncbi:HNH endonuclease signature motif containing protein [Solicola gregarius]|uniref:HNH endonuclease n=1 Tax=Solicola gregarius TaxID=2908642 RepID=A0AA46THB4_9ACTN|nr:HNH endonuclease signature motif containing protein [Solicola gregarius]UYM05178.1 HNH endonuclease [Solicola gregarius]
MDFLDESAADPNVLRLAGAERVHPYGGDGTPDIPEFAVCEVAAALGLANQSAASLVADMLDLRHRLPLLFGCLRNGDVESWRVRRVASGTRELDLETAGRVDERLARAASDGAPVLARMSRSRVRKVIDQIACKDDAEQADDEAAYNLANRSVRISRGPIGVDEISGTLASGAAQRLYARVDEIAGWLGEVDDADGEDRRPKDVRRSIALTMLADHDQVADLFDQVQRLRRQCATDPDTPDNADTPVDADTSDDTDGPGTVPQRSTRLPATVLYVHLDAASGTWSLDGHGPITRTEAVDLVGHSRVTVKPVIDLAENLTYTGYVAPPRLKEQTALANEGYCTFPHCTSSAWRGEYDHIVDYHARGPTDSRNGHRLCKHHHRAKTFGGWTVISPMPGVWVWRSPRARFYHVTEGTTTPLDLDLFRYAA